MHDNPFAPTPRLLRQFAGLWIIFFGGAAAWHGLYHGRYTVAVVLAILSVTIGPVGLANPAVIRPVYVCWMHVAYPIGWIVSRLVLGLLFYGLFTPIGLVFRVIGRDELKVKPRSGVETYWTAKPQVSGKAGYLRQF
jgi:Saxitoxin biosynthesis operon protein SxtJ